MGPPWQAPGQRSTRGGDPGPRQGGDVGASERGRARKADGETLGVKQTVGAMLLVGLVERSARSRRMSVSVEKSKSPSRHNARMILTPSSDRPVAFAARAAAIIPRLKLRRLAGEMTAATFAGALQN